MSVPSPEPTPLDCARHLLGALPPLMQAFRAEMRQAVPAGLSVPQFRVLIYAQKHPGSSISDIAAHLGVTLPTASVAVDRLVRQGLLETAVDAGNRRRRAVDLTAQGHRAVERAQSRTAHALAGRLDALSPDQLVGVCDALTLLQAHLAPDVVGTDA